MNLILTGGGTGGHICPLLGLADTARSLEPAVEITFVGEASGLENRLVPQAGYPLRALKGRPLPRRFSLKSLGALAALAAALPRATALLRELHADAVIGTGGYASACVLYAATRLRLPTFVIELNAVPGRTTRVLARRLTRVCTQFEETADHLPAATCALTGSPVRTPFREVAREAARTELGVADDEFCLLAFGGSQAARSINLAIQQALPALAESGLRLRLVHLCGEDFLAQAEGLARGFQGEGGLLYAPEAYRQDLWTLLGAADVAVCRAGGSSLSELSVVGVPAVLIPYPYATNDHQTRNAAHFARAGAAVVVPDQELTGARLSNECLSLVRAPARRAALATRARGLGFPEAAERLLELMHEALDQRSDGGGRT